MNPNNPGGRQRTRDEGGLERALRKHPVLVIGSVGGFFLSIVNWAVDGDGLRGTLVGDWFVIPLRPYAPFVFVLTLVAAVCSVPKGNDDERREGHVDGSRPPARGHGRP